MWEIPRLLTALRMGRPGLAAVIVGAACLGLPSVASAAGHTVLPGETLSGIAAANGLTPAALAAANGLTPTSFVISGTVLSIPAPGPGAPSTGTGVPATAGDGHLVLPGETLSGIASANGVTTTALAEANGISSADLVIAGTRLTVPAAGAGTAQDDAGPAATAGAGAGHLVVPGETLSGIAAANGVATAALAAANGLSPTSFVIAGTRLTVPAAAGQAGTGQVQAGVPNAPMPTPVRLSGAEIGEIAAQNGIAPSLAQAVAWQESGFNNAVLSSANARGIMQIIPPTWQFIQSSLASSPLDPESPVDNVRAGSLLLRHLLEGSGGDPAIALAGYYQGQDSVRRIGLLPETQRYVANVLALRDRYGP